MFKHELFDNYAFEDIPLNRDIYLMGEQWMPEYERSMVALFNGAEYEAVGYISYAAGRNVSADALEFSWYPNIHDRFHEVKAVLPRREFLSCVGCYHYDEKPRIFVKDSWLSQLYLRGYSAFMLIDAIGVKAELKAGRLDRTRLIKLRDEVDALAARHPTLAFVSLADSLVVKGNWSVGHVGSGVTYTYQPEVFVRLVPEIQKIYRDVLGLNVYAIFAQGVNQYCEDAPTHVSNTGNHLCLNSLGLPFAQLFAIDDAARKAIRDGTHKPHELYIDEDFYHSLRFKWGFDKNSKPRASYRDPMTGGFGTYFYADSDALLGNVAGEPMQKTPT